MQAFLSSGSSMGGRLVFHSVLVLWLVQSAHTGGYGAGVSGVHNGHEAHFNGKRGNSGAGAPRMLIPSKGVGSPMGAHNGYGGYPNKGVGYGGVAGMANGAAMKGYGAGRGQGGWPQGHGSHAGSTNQHLLKGNGYRAHAGAFAGQGNKGIGYGGPAAGPQNGNKGQMKGYGTATGALGGNAKPNGHGRSGLANKGYGYGAKAGVPNGVGNSGLAGARRKPVKGYGQPYYGAGLGVGGSHGQGVPQLTRNQGKAYGGYGPQPMGGYTGGYGSAGMGLGPRYGNGGLKGPKPGYAGARSQNGIGGIPTGYGYPNGGANNPVKPGYGNIPNGNGVKPNGYGAGRGGYATGVALGGYGAKPTGYGAGAGGTKGYGPKPNGPGAGSGPAFGEPGNKLKGYGPGGLGPGSHPQTTKGLGPASHGQGIGGAAGIPNQPAKLPNSGFGQMPYGKGPKMPSAPNGKGLKGGGVSPHKPGSTFQEGAPPHRPIIEGDSVPAPEPTAGRLVLVTQDQYQRLPSPVPQGKNYMLPQATPAYIPVFPQGKEPKLGPESSPGLAGGRPIAPPQENGGGAPISKGQGAKAGKLDCGPGGPNGQWIKIPRPGAGVAAGTNTKGYGAGAGVPNRFGFKPGYGAGGYTGSNTGYGAGLGYPNAGKPQQPIYRQGANFGGAGYVKGNSYPGNAGPGANLKAGYPNGYVAGVQPDYANLGHGVPKSDAKSGVGVQVPYDGPPAGPVAVDGANQPEPQPVGNQGPVYGGMEGLPYGAQPGMGPEKASAKYGIGGLQFGGNPQTGNNGGVNYGYGLYGPAADVKSGKYGAANMGGVAPGQYGYGGIPNNGHQGLANNGHKAGKYGYGRMLHEVQPVGFVPQLTSPAAGQYVPAALPYQSGLLGLGPNLIYGGGDGSYEPLGAEEKPAGQLGDNLGIHQGQPLQSSASDGRSGRAEAGSPYESLPGTAESASENVGYISGSKLQPEVISLPAAPSPLPLDSAFTPGGADDLTGGAGGLAFNSEADRGSEQPGDSEQMPRQVHIQQQLKLHFHPQGSKNSKYDLNGFFGNQG